MERAPGRGHYDRRLDRSLRAVSERERIERAVLEHLAERNGSLQVGSICRAAGIGRNTLYLHFAGIETCVAQVLRSAEERLATALEEALDLARTPRMRILRLAASWLAFAAEQPLMVQALRHQESSFEPLPVALSQAVKEAQVAGLIGSSATEERVAAIVAGFVEVGLRARGQSATWRSEAAEWLLELTLRSLR